MNRDSPITSIAAAPASIRKLAQLARGTESESEMDSAAFLAALVSQLDTLKASSQFNENGDNSNISSAEANESRANLLHELLQYVSKLDALSTLQAINEGESGEGCLPGNGDSLPQTASANQELEPEECMADPALAVIASLLVPQTHTDRTKPAGLESEDASNSLGQTVHRSRGQEAPGSNSLDHGGALDTQVPAPNTGFSHLLDKESNPKDSVTLGAGEVLFQSDKESAATAGTAETIRSLTETGFPLEAEFSTSQLSTVVVDREIPALDKPLSQAAWPEGLGERILWMTDKNIRTAEIKLNPQHLGPLEIRIQMEQDRATIHFTTHHASVREAIEAAVPKLREMLGSQEISLSDINVTVPSESSNQSGSTFDLNQQPRFRDQAQSFPEHDSMSKESVSADRGEPVAADGLLNLYA
jgi:flagellar hook-length control protein FliK